MEIARGVARCAEKAATGGRVGSGAYFSGRSRKGRGVSESIHLYTCKTILTTVASGNNGHPAVARLGLSCWVRATRLAFA